MFQREGLKGYGLCVCASFVLSLSLFFSSFPLYLSHTSISSHTTDNRYKILHTHIYIQIYMRSYIHHIILYTVDYPKYT